MSASSLEVKELDGSDKALTLEAVNSHRNLHEYLCALMDFSEELQFSDIMLEEGEEVWYRVPAGWQSTGYGKVDTRQLEELIALIRQADAEGHRVRGVQPNEDRILLSVTMGRWRIRCTIFTCNARLSRKLMIRKLPEVVPKLADLGLGVLVQQLVRAQRGLLVISGPTSAGKSTTMAAIFQEMLNTRPIHGVTIEEPIEYLFAPGKGRVSQREVGADVDGFEQGLAEAMRQTPDAILVGEVRSRAEAETALRAAEHGRFVLMSTHGRDVVSALQKILSFFPGDEHLAKSTMLANHLVCVLQQALVPSLKRSGWELAYESLFVGEGKRDVVSVIADPAKHAQLREMLARGDLSHSTSMNKVLAKLVGDKRVSRDEALAASVDPENLKNTLEGARS